MEEKVKKEFFDNPSRQREYLIKQSEGQIKIQEISLPIHKKIVEVGMDKSIEDNKAVRKMIGLVLSVVTKTSSPDRMRQLGVDLLKMFVESNGEKEEKTESI